MRAKERRVVRHDVADFEVRMSRVGGRPKISLCRWKILDALTNCFDVGGMRSFKKFIDKDEADRGPTKPPGLLSEPHWAELTRLRLTTSLYFYLKGNE